MHHWGYFVIASPSTDKAERVRSSLVTEAVADYFAFKNFVETFFDKFEFEGYYRAMLRSQVEAGAESIAEYATRTTDVCYKAYAGLVTDPQLSLAANYLMSGLADATLHDYFLHDRAHHALQWQETMQMAQTRKALRLTLHQMLNDAAV